MAKLTDLQRRPVKTVSIADQEIRIEIPTMGDLKQLDRLEAADKAYMLLSVMVILDGDDGKDQRLTPEKWREVEDQLPVRFLAELAEKCAEACAGGKEALADAEKTFRAGNQEPKEEP